MNSKEKKNRTVSPPPFNLAFLLLAIALGMLIISLLAIGALGNFSSQPSVLQQAQAGESPTSETVEPSATFVVTETATLELTLTPIETATSVAEPTATETPSVEPTAIGTEEPTLEPSPTVIPDTPTVFVEPTETQIPATDAPTDQPTKTPTVEPSNTPEPSPTQELPTSTPEAENETILFESDGALYEQPVDREGNPRSGVTPLVGKNVVEGRILKLVPSPNGNYIYYVVRREPNCTDCESIEIPYIFSLAEGEIFELSYPLPKIFGWHPNGVDLIFGDDGGSIGLFNVQKKEIHSVLKVQKWLDVPWEPIVYGAAFSPDGNQLVVSFGLTGRGIGHQSWIANGDGSDPKRVIENNDPIFEFAWSPDGRNIAFLGKGLEIIQPDGQNRRTVSRNFSIGLGFRPRWSPDSRYIAFEAYEELPPNSADMTDIMQQLFQYHKIHILEVETNTETRLIADEFGGEINPAWSLDSKRIAFLSNRSGPFEVWVADLNGQNLQQLTFDGQLKRAEVIWQSLSRR